MTAATDALNARRDELIESRRAAAAKLAEAQAVVADVQAGIDEIDVGISEIEDALAVLGVGFETEVTAKEAARAKQPKKE